MNWRSDGRVYELEGDQTIKVTETNGKTKQLFELLKFTQAETFTLASAGATPPDVINAVARGGSQHTNQAGLKLITSFEGRELTAYQDTVKVWTVGYGHTKDVHEGMTITQAKAEQLLREDLAKFK